MTDLHEDQIAFRATVISLLLYHSAKMDGPFKVLSLFEAVTAELQVPEEYCGEEVMGATGILIRSGMLQYDGYFPERDEIVYGAEIMMRASPQLLKFVWRERVFDEDIG